MLKKELAKVPRPLGRRERRSGETREKILRAAINLFAKRGFNATTIEAIAESADIGKGTFFNYFENKESILLEYQKMRMSKVGAFLKESINSDEPLIPHIYKLALTMTTEYQKSPALVQSLIIALFSNDTIRARLSKGQIRGIEMLAEIIKKRQRSGEIRSDLSAKEIVYLFQRVLHGTIALWSLAPERTLNEELRDTVKIFVKGIQTE